MSWEEKLLSEINRELQQVYNHIKTYSCKTHEINRIGALYWTENDALIVKLTWANFEVEKLEYGEYRTKGKYVPGELYRTIAPRITESLGKPGDVQFLVVAAHGILHPLRKGLATALEEAWSIPTIGISKKLLIGTPTNDLAKYYTRDEQEMIWRKVVIQNEFLGGMAETHYLKRYVSPGGKISLNILPYIYADMVIGATVTPLFIAKKCYSLLKGSCLIKK